MDQQANTTYLRQHSRAMQALQKDFRFALAHGGYATTATPHDSLGCERSLVDCVAQQMDDEPDCHTLNELLCIMQRAAWAGDIQARSLIERLALAHASHYTHLMDDNGDLDAAPEEQSATS